MRLTHFIPQTTAHALLFYGAFGSSIPSNEYGQPSVCPPETSTTASSIAHNADYRQLYIVLSAIVNELAHQRFSPTIQQQLDPEQIPCIT